MNDRDELTRALFMADNHNAAEPAHEWEMLTRHGPKHVEHYYVMADAILAAGYRKPRTITTAEELDALDINSVVLDQTGDVLKRWTREVWLSTDEEDATYVELPATVLYEPGA